MDKTFIWINARRLLCATIISILLSCSLLTQEAESSSNSFLKKVPPRYLSNGNSRKSWSHCWCGPSGLSLNTMCLAKFRNDENSLSKHKGHIIAAFINTSVLVDIPQYALLHLGQIRGFSCLVAHSWLHFKHLNICIVI